MHEMKEMVGGCCVCLKDDGWYDDPLVFCDGHGCNVAVHKDCYGIVTVPSGPWFCRKCEFQQPDAKVSCELCPSKTGALKRTDNGKWAHVVCALYIPEIGFGNLATMEPILLNSTPPNRFYKSCCICEHQGKESNSKIGVCMNCNKPGCKNQFHVTCAQALGLLCEEAGNFSAVKYCGYCPHHLSQMKKRTKLKTVSTFKSPSASSGPTNPALEKSSSSINGSFEHPPGSSSTNNEIKERKRKKNSCKASSSAGNREWTTSEFSSVLAGVGLTPKPSIKESDIDQSNFSEALSQEADRKSSGSKKKSKLSRFVPRMPSLIRRLSAPAMTSAEHTTPISPKTECTTSQESCSNVGALASLCRGNDTESASMPEIESLTSVIGPSTNVEMTLSSISDVQKVAASTTAGSSSQSNSSDYVAPNSTNVLKQRATIKMGNGSGQNNLSSISPKSTNDRVKEIHKEPVPAPLPKIEKPRRNRAPKAPPLATSSTPSRPDFTEEKHSSKRREKEEEKIPEKASSSTVDDLYPGSTEPKQSEMNPKIITRSVVSSNFYLQEYSLPEAPQIHLQTSNPGSFTATKISTTPLKDPINAPQMLGNELNSDSGTAQEMSDLLSAEVDMHTTFTVPSPTPSTSSSLVGVPFPLRNVSSVINSTMAALSSAPALHHLADLLERQWEQGSQFLMEQAQHYDIASLLSSLHAIQQGNKQLEDRVAGLIQRRDRLLAVNARLSVPLTVQPVTQAPFVTNSGNQPEGSSTAGSFIGQSIEKGSTEQLPSYIEAYSRADKIHHPVHPTGGLPSTISPVQGSTGFSSFTPEMAQSTGTPTMEQQLLGLHRLRPHPISVSAVSIQHSVNVRREVPDGRLHHPLVLS